MGSLVLQPVRTPWATPGDHNAVAVNLDRILFDLGVGDSWVRRRLTAHAIVACGWKQLCWCFNAWGVQRGGWTGDWYVKGTKEIEAGEEVYHALQEWRAFESWEDALDDTLERAEKNAGRWSTLNDASAPDGDYWAATKAAKYFTAPLDVGFFESICRRVSRELGYKPTQAEKKKVICEVAIGALALLGLALLTVGAWRISR